MCKLCFPGHSCHGKVRQIPHTGPCSVSARGAEGPGLLMCFLEYFGVLPQGCLWVLRTWPSLLLHSILHVLRASVLLAAVLPPYHRECGAQAEASGPSLPPALGNWFLLCLGTELASPYSCVSPMPILSSKKKCPRSWFIYGCIKITPQT